MRDAVAERFLAEETMRGPAAVALQEGSDGGASSSSSASGVTAAQLHPAATEGGWSDVLLKETLLPRDGGSAVVSLGHLASGQQVEWRWMAGSARAEEHADVHCSLEMETPVTLTQHGKSSGGGSAAAAIDCELEASHVVLHGDSSTVHSCAARTHASSHHWLKWTRRRTLLERLHFAGTPAVTIFLQVRVS
jgi:hypothetical protein